MQWFCAWMRRVRFKRWNARSRCCRWGSAASRAYARLPAPRDDTLFAALDTAKGTVITQCRQRQRHQEYLDFLRQIEKNVPTELDVHVIVDNYATHKHPRVQRWFAARPRYHVHFTPTYASGHSPRVLSQRERTSRENRPIRSDLQHPRPPFHWTATADSIFAKVQRLCERIYGTGH
jgi:putative transposase